MKTLLLLLAVIFGLNNAVEAQTISAEHPQTQPFGIIDTADLKMSSCDFERDANAMVLFDKAEVKPKFASVIMERHKRIKIFNDNGKDEANIRIEYYGAHKDEIISDIEAETINLDGKTIEYTNIDKKLIYNQVIDKQKIAIIFTFPNVRAGSVIEFKYRWSTPYPFNYPDWYFQTTIPSRYSEFDASFDSEFKFNFLKKVRQPLAKDTAIAIGSKNNLRGARFIWAMSNIKTFKDEPFMDFPEDYQQCILLRRLREGSTWVKEGNAMMDDEDFGLQLHKILGNEDEIIARANALKTNDEKIAYLFNLVKTTMTWNKVDLWYTVDGVKKAWDKKNGNSTEINLILYHLLSSANVNTILMALSTRENGKLDTDYPTLLQFNKTVVYCPVDSAKYYVLDASNKYNTYNIIPFDLVGLHTLSLDVKNQKFGIFPIKNGSAREVMLITGSINPEGKLDGNFQISSSSYNRAKYLKKYNDLGEKKYTEQLEKENNGLKIMSLKMGNLENDTLPLNQNFDFKYNLTEPDDAYMYFNPNQITSFHDNPFLNETRVSNIDLGCLYSYAINGRFKIPAGYKIDALPKSVSMSMPEKEIIFKRIIADQDGEIIVHYTIDYKRSIFSVDEYPSIRDFYKKMYEMLNEQIVLKKL